MQSVLRRHCSGCPAACRAPRFVRVYSNSRSDQPQSIRGVQRGPVQPAEVVDSASTRQPTDPEQETEDFILLQSAISKTYRQKLLEFRRTVTPATLASMRAGLPPEHLPQLEMILREAAELGEDDEFEPFGSAAGPDAGASPLELSDEEQLAMDMLRDTTLPSDFLSYLSQMVSEGADEYELQQLLAQIPGELLAELQDLFWELKDFEASDDLDTDVVAQRYVALSERISALSEEVDQRSEEQQRHAGGEQQEVQQVVQQQQQQQQQQRQQQRRRVYGPAPPDLSSSGAPVNGTRNGNSSSRGGTNGATDAGSNRPVLAAAPAWQQARQQQRRSMATSAL